mmetsp:Transcript_19581/g.33325  ORF Transcript_19581/g.33325 Transcript_19581/m.33325 type:complete len:227 (+) Transcript_19581:674-1354(+)
MLDEVVVGRERSVGRLVVVLEADANVPAHGDRHVREGHLELADPDGGPRVPRLQHRDQVPQLPQRALLRVRRAHHEPKVEGPLQQALLDEVVGVGDHVGVEDLDLRLDARLRVLDRHVVGQLRVVLVHDRPEVDRAGRVRAHLREQVQRVHAPGADVHAGAWRTTARGDLNDHVRVALLHQPARLAKLVDPHGRLQVLVSSVDVQHGDTELDTLVHLVCHLLRGTR